MGGTELDTNSRPPLGHHGEAEGNDVHPRVGQHVVGDRGGGAGTILAGEHDGDDRMAAREQVEASDISVRKRDALRCNVSRACEDVDTNSRAFSDPATTAGATEFEKR